MSADLEQKMADVDFVLTKVREEIQRAYAKHRPYASAHEAWAIIREELDELWDEVKADNGYTMDAVNEAQQVAATAVRYIVDLWERVEAQPANAAIIDSAGKNTLAGADQRSSRRQA